MCKSCCFAPYFSVKLVFVEQQYSCCEIPEEIKKENSAPFYFFLLKEPWMLAPAVKAEVPFDTLFESTFL